MQCGSKGSNLIPSVVFTTLFCLAIAVLTSSIWSASYLENAIISLGYGYSAVTCSWLVKRFLPKIAQLNLVAVGLSLVGAVCLGTLNAYLWLKQYPGFDEWQGLKPILLLGLIFTAISFYFFYVQEKQFLLQQQVEQAKFEKATQDKALIESELKQLQSQIEPHFLFNTLANINVLIDYDKNQAKEVLDKLTVLLRGSMSRHRERQVDVASEIALIEAYLGIQQVRLGERLTYNIDIPAELDTFHLPPYLLQPLVENAVIHGIEPSVAGGHIQIKGRVEKGGCTLQVIDSGGGFGAVENEIGAGHGIGLANVRERLSTLYGKASSLSVSAGQEQGVVSTIILPSPINKEV
ncbi:sensor histidine kinase [Vibrio methylphosphonaticus]|uniref:sensor histidine kinase n=1 Tax=Vibrio methylphosphonaticus TaxID=2946866 RepID=UPI00202A7C9C|nr:sensor histidine kinase [Vibrio methylphosphonaticus]MCL9776265.1 sensor histidine kinase [Vibrio methylphosphonaticus]